ncbi:MAG: indole-3-glycerol phosphate synthase TrpC [Candidatus Altiarchaeota archaeon]
MDFLQEIASSGAREASFARASSAGGSPMVFRRRLSLAEALGKPGMSFICEFKRKSPAEGVLSEADSVSVAREYEAAGASAISVLTEGPHFGGSLEDLSAVKDVAGIPVLRKDFIVSVRQIEEAIFFGADAILLIVALLKEKTPEFVDFARNLGLECLVEVHDGSELEYALESGSNLLGVNNRDLKTLNVDLGTFEAIAPKVPKDMLLVAESGIKTRHDVRRMEDAGADAVLIGSSLMRSHNIAEKLGELMR